MATQGLVAVTLPRAQPRRRQENTVLAVGDERVHKLALAGRRGAVRGVTAFDIAPEAETAAAWHELVIDAASVQRIGQEHPEVLRRAGRIWVVPSEDVEGGATQNPFDDPLPAVGRVVKRALDVTLALLALLLVLPVLVLAGLAVRCDSRGPALFRQVRMGKDGRRFRLYKLRTMDNGNDDRTHREFVARLIAGTTNPCGGLYKLADDPRVTRVGRVLRRFSIDELPQLWNVLRGDMSLVGPRPPLPQETELYTARAWGRLRVKPGMTGLWQVSGRSRLAFEDMVSLDVRYWQHWSLLSDLVILLKTPRTVLSGRDTA
ncbi:MAG TPA: sugar transferase [Acidimicrobiales bacterium]|nr:sugar transferase [Acidimicrobiales bacterium]